jgi:hypothetical protein
MRALPTTAHSPLLLSDAAVAAWQAAMSALVDTLRGCCNELLACSPDTLRSVATAQLRSQHGRCSVSDEPCDVCNAKLILARILHAIAVASEEGTERPHVKCANCSNDCDGTIRSDGRAVCLDCSLKGSR